MFLFGFNLFGFNFLDLGIYILYGLIFIFFIFSFLKVRSKSNSLLRPIFLFQFLLILSVCYSIFNINISILDLSFLFLLNYMLDANDFYSEIDSNTSGKILKSLHELLNNLDLSKYKLGGGGPNPDGFNWGFFFNPDILDIGEKPDKSLSYLESKPFDYNSVEVINMRNKIYIHNNMLEYAGKKDFINEKNFLIKRNFSIEQFRDIYSMMNITYDVDNPYVFLHSLRYSTYNNIKTYNLLLTIKNHQESMFKFIFPSEFNKISDYWFSAQSNTYLQDSLKVSDKSERYVNNFLNKKLVNHELYDNILIIGIGILCKDFILTKLTNYYSSNLVEGINNVDFYIKA